ncbi:MAG: 5-methyltetrahydropteroyltriglutamate--homocysteine S-methyltransferase [Hyphomicrobiales bacterium]|nr:5-methyltetrahydropteroyltriglutamate--homocysteine S-methyltransferase [Hyphomicrobiales bacterium]
MPASSPAPRAPYRADHVGSLLRPAELREARERYIVGELPADKLKALEDKHIRDAVKMQEDIGLQSITDGEFRRTSFHFDFLGQLAGVEAKLQMPAPAQEGAAPAPKVFRPPQLAITGKLRHVKPIELDAYRFLRSATTRTPKITMPSPTMCLRGGRAAVSREAYPDLEAYYADVAAAYGAELRALSEAGCAYVQFDDTNFAYLCDVSMREDMKARGDDPDETLDRYIRVFNSVLAQKPAGMTFVTHICRGNLHSRWAAQGGYEPVAEKLFGALNVDGYFLEYDSERAGGFEPLRFVPRYGAKRVVLGLISSKLAEIEDRDVIARRIEEAGKFMPVDQMCLSPQCGFASSFRGNQLGEDVERRKLEQVVEIAISTWGSAT